MNYELRKDYYQQIAKGLLSCFSLGDGNALKSALMQISLVQPDEFDYIIKEIKDLLFNQEHEVQQ